MRNTSINCRSLQNPSIFFTPLHIFFWLHLFTILITGNSQSPYVPPDNIAFDCGSATRSVIDGRVWSADLKLFLQEQNSSSTAIVPLNTTVNPVPYSTARLSRSPFTYTYPVTSSGPKFIRLHFYSVAYPAFNNSKAIFSVKAGRCTLFSNFSAYLHAQALGTEVFDREFCLNVEDDDQVLNITFTPSSDVLDSYAFINGIEIVSMPANLYYSAPDDPGFELVGGANTFRIADSTALELMYRVNVGGDFISPQNDTGMFRSWSTDNQYSTDGLPRSIDSNKTIQLRYDSHTRYAAPDLVYQTARAMGPNLTINMNYNLTWEFQVDSMFFYLVRLHFCEFNPLIQKGGYRSFQIYIADQIAETYADVIFWSGGNGVPVHKDYAVMMDAKGSKKVQNLSIALHPRTRDSVYVDAILNGVEIFKLSNLDIRAGQDTTLTDAPSPKSTKPKNKQTTIVAIVGAVSGFVAICLLSFLVFWRIMKAKHSKPTKTYSSSLPSDLCHHFSLADIKAATNDFDDLFIIGVGGFGNVYKGFIDSGATAVAIKRLNPESRQGAHEFKTEIEMLSPLHHIHLVSLIGYCNDEGEMILVYDYMINGTLREHLYESNNDPIPWKKRLEICIGAASGLHYLHTGMRHPIIHRDVKTTNILLDENLVAKVSDFGLSKLCSNNTAVSTMVKGTWGYLDPEYARLQKLTEKSDVYSFGVVLLEVLCARKPLDQNLEEEQWNLAYWARECMKNGTMQQIIDPYLAGRIAPECFKKFVEIAESCLRDRGIERPTMHGVMEKLKSALELQMALDAVIEGMNPGGQYVYPETSFHASSYANTVNEFELSSRSIVSTIVETDTTLSLQSGSIRSGDSNLICTQLCVK